MNRRPQSILSAWTALEVLSPSTFRRPEELAGSKTLVAKIDEDKLPWERGEYVPPKRHLYYQVVLGAIRMEPAIKLLVERYGDTRVEKPASSVYAALAVIIVDRQGHCAASPAVAVSSFGWGVMTALQRELSDLALWPSVEPQLVAQLEKLLRSMTSDDDGNGKPLTRAGIMRAYDELITTLGLPTELLEPPEFAIRSYTSSSKKSPELILLNSFYLDDLASARDLFAHNQAPGNLRRYLGVERPTKTQDLLINKEALENAVSPRNTPLARWPGAGRKPLVLLQQAAVNIAFGETAPTGLVGINGPPGTGKTTLLRDLVAGIVTERAKAMAEFDDPEEAFETTGQSLHVGSGSARIHLYKLDESLKGFEMVVASSNNKAVENISAELPGLKAITDDADFRYFKTISDFLHEDKTWGLIAAVLGNAQNRSRFKQRFWWDDENGLRSYLRAAAGAIPMNDDGLPLVIRVEQPPTREEALERWEMARDRFLEALKRSEEWQQRLESVRTDVLAIPGLAQAEEIALQQHLESVAKVKRLLQEHQNSTREIKSASEELRIHASKRPGFWARLFRTKAARQWNEFQSALLELRAKESTLQDAHSAHKEVTKRIAECQEKYGGVVIDSTFFKQNPRERHQTSPWFPTAAQRARDEVFIAAMALHRAFIDAAAKRLKNNLDGLMSVFASQSLQTSEKQALLPDLWASLFLVVPLVSTTFASVNRMLGKLPPESLGWLLIDEAGQASPQSAVGAIMRTKRAVIVGDPVQIEPVVTLSDKLTNAICLQFGVKPEEYSAPESSVQTLADAASGYSSEFSAKIGSRTVGVPLLVHRRCSEPMFTIANTIAYDHQMVWAKDEKLSSGIRKVLGPSRWIDVVGNGEDKWCSQEGEEVVRLLSQLAQEGASSELYVITPFRVVADGLRRMIRTAGVLQGWINEEEWTWLTEHVGTVHTAQGREAEAVIIVLGAPNPSQTGARIWAGKHPNILNVAVTRAKEVIYVVGNRKLWREAGVFADLDKYLPR